MVCYLIAALVFVSALTTGNAENTEAEIGITEPGIAEAGSPAPDFLLIDLEQNPVRLSDFRGKPLILNFFASWCSPCLKELPLIQDAYLRAADQGFIVLGVGYQDSRWAIEELAEDAGLTFPIVIDGDNSVGQAYRVIGPPYTFFIDADGIVVDVVSGAMDPDILQRNLDKLLKTGNTDAV
jgi:peroxiredoxin